MKTAPNATCNTEDFEFEALDEARNYRKALLREFGPHLEGNVLEVGAGVGQLTAMLRTIPAIRRLCAVEPDENFCERIRSTFPDQLLVHGTVENVEQRQRWNAILSVNVLEHIEDDQNELQRYGDLLRGEGWLCLFVPARPEIYAPIDRDFGHFRRYTRGALQSKLESAGFSIQKIRYYNLFGYLAWWLHFRVLGKRSFARNRVRVFDRFIFPAVNWFETQISAPPIGQSLLVIAKAKAVEIR